MADELAHLRRLPRNPDPDAGDATPPRTPHCILEQQTSLSAAHAELELAARGNATVRPIPLLLQSPSVDDSPVGSAEMHRKQRLKRQEWKRRVQTALEGLCQAISLLGEVSGDPGMPNWVGVASKGASMIIKMVKQTKANIRDVATLLERIEALTQRINRWCSPQTTVPPSIRDHVSRLLRTWSSICEDAIELRLQGRCVRFTRWSLDADQIAGLIGRFGDSMAECTFEVVLETRAAVQRIEATAEATHVGVTSILTTVQTMVDLKGIDILVIAKRARFDSISDVASCMKGTRIEILHDIKLWIRPEARNMSAASSTQAQARNSADHNILWLNGIAGTGKTTIAYTIAKWCDELSLLGASFFCSRSDSECSDASKIFLTLAYQLAHFHRPYGQLLADVLRADPLLVEAAVPTQLEKLIVGPLQKLPTGSKLPECVVLVDAADECDKKTTTSALISSLLLHATALRPIRFLITSRPEKHISVPFNRSKFKDTSGRLVLHLVELAQVTRDIELYLWTLLCGDVAEQFALSRSWPDIGDIKALARLAKGLFIFAATLVRYISDVKYSNPPAQLRRILSSPTSSYEFLDKLYLQVLESAVADASDELVDTMRSLLGSIVLAKEPLSPNTLAALLGLDAIDVVNALAGLHAVLIIPALDQLDKLIRIIHPTFAEFLTNPERCTDPLFLVVPSVHHAILLDHCLRIMTTHLKRDICDIRDPTLLRSEIVDLSTRITQRIPAHLAYSCRHWAAHAEPCEVSDDLLQKLSEFAHRNLLNWVEACSLIGILREAIIALDAAERRLKHGPKRFQTPLELFNDSFRFVVAAYPTICALPLHVYQSALQLVPCETVLAGTLGEEMQYWARAVRGIPAFWSPLLRSFAGHGGVPVRSVQFSPDNTTFVSAGNSRNDNSVNVWDTASCVRLLSLEGHHDAVSSAQFSPNGAYIVSASDDKTIRVWDTASGTPVKVLEGHTDWVQTAVFTPDSKHLVSGSDDHSVKVWDVETGGCVATFQAHCHEVTSVAVSPNGLLIASGSDRSVWEPIYLWEAKDNKLFHAIGCSGARAFVFTPDSTQLIVQEEDGPGLDVWNVQTQTRLRRLCGAGFPSEPVACLAISSDGARLACCTRDHRVLLVDVVGGDVLRELSGHTTWINSVSFTSDGTRLLSCSDDHSIRLWDTTPREADSSTHPVNNPSTGSLIHAAFADDGTLLTLGKAGDVDVYHPVTWACEPFWRDGSTKHSAEYDEIYFSPDKTSGIVYQGLEDSVRLELVSMSAPGSTDIHGPQLIESAKGEGFKGYNPRGVGESMWDAICGYARHCFGSASSPMVLSEDGRYLARTKSRDIALYSTKLRQDILVFTGRPVDILCVAFSLDGQQLVSGADDKIIRVWMTQVEEAERGSPTRSPCLTLVGHERQVGATAFSSDATKIVSGSNDRTVRVWNAQSGECLCVFVGHKHWVTSVAFTPEGETVISTSVGGTLRIWDVASQDCLTVFEHGTWHNTLRLAPNGSGILVREGESERLIRMWSSPDTPPEVTASLPWLPSRTWPAYNIDRERWLWSVAPGRKARRMCQIPEDWNDMVAFRESIVVFEGGQIMDMSALDRYFDDLQRV